MMALTTGSQVTQRPTGDQPGLHGSAILPWITSLLSSDYFSNHKEGGIKKAKRYLVRLHRCF